MISASAHNFHLFIFTYIYLRMIYQSMFGTRCVTDHGVHKTTIRPMDFTSNMTRSWSTDFFRYKNVIKNCIGHCVNMSNLGSPNLI